jgi:hypothetical protein
MLETMSQQRYFANHCCDAKCAASWQVRVSPNRSEKLIEIAFERAGGEAAELCPKSKFTSDRDAVLHRVNKQSRALSNL